MEQVRCIIVLGVVAFLMVCIFALLLPHPDLGPGVTAPPPIHNNWEGRIRPQ